MAVKHTTMIENIRHQHNQENTNTYDIEQICQTVTTYFYTFRTLAESAFNDLVIRAILATFPDESNPLIISDILRRVEERFKTSDGIEFVEAQGDQPAMYRITSYPPHH